VTNANRFRERARPFIVDMLYYVAEFFARLFWRRKSDAKDELYLVPVRREEESFGWIEIICSFVFAGVIAGVNLYQRYLLNKDPNGDLPGDWDALVALHLASGASMFFLTAAVLLFLSYESSKISLFIKGFTRQIAIIYIASIGLITLMSHVDAFTADKDSIIIASHSMLLVVSFAETTIDVKIADCFEKISSHYERVSHVYRKAKRWAIAIFVANVLITLSELAHYVPALKFVTFVNASIRTLLFIIVADFFLLLWLRFNLRPSRDHSKDKKSLQ
jgi:hypothetical protein